MMSWISIFLLILLSNNSVRLEIECQEDDVECHEKLKYTKGYFSTSKNRI